MKLSTRGWFWLGASVLSLLIWAGIIATISKTGWSGAATWASLFALGCAFMFDDANYLTEEPDVVRCP